MKIIPLLFAALAASATVTPSARASVDILIDGFTSAPAGVYPITVDSGEPVVRAGFEYLPDVLSGVRYVSLTRSFASLPGGDSPVTLDIASSAPGLSISAPSFYASRLDLFYAFVPPGPDAPAIDVSSAQAFLFTVSSYTSTNNQPLTIRPEVYDNFGEVTSFTRSIPTSATPFTILLPFSDFIPTSEFSIFDYSNIDDLTFTLDLPPGGQIEIASIRAIAIPEPTLALSLAPLALLRRRPAR